MSETNTVQTHDGGTITGNTASAEMMAEAFQKAPEPAEKHSDDPDETLDGSEGVEPPVEPVKRSEAKRDMKARMLEATQKEAAAKRERDEIEARALKAENELKALRERAGADPKPEPKRPDEKKESSDDPWVSDDGLARFTAATGKTEDDYSSYGNFVVAASQWAARHENAEISKRTEAEQTRASFHNYQIEQVKKFNERVSKYAETNPDLTLPPDVVELLPVKPFDLDHQMSSDDLIGVYFTNEERGLDLMVYFKDHLDELGKIRTLTPGRVAIELARIEGRLNGAITAPPAKPEIQRASPPVRPVTATPPSVDDPNSLPDATLSNVEWARKREALEERRRKAAR